MLRILFYGDIVGKPGRKAIKTSIPQLQEHYQPDIIIANGENATHGMGITPKMLNELLQSGVDIVTSGNHVWDQKEIYQYIDQSDRMIRPANYPKGAPGKGYLMLSEPFRMVVVNLSGRLFMPTLDCPFAWFDRNHTQLRRHSPVILIDFHAETTSEKLSFAYHVATKVSAVICTHTHVQTADERIIQGHTAYISDVGMTGPRESVIGVKPHLFIQKFITAMPVKFEVAGGETMINAVVIDIDENNGRAISIQRINQLT